MSRENVVRLDRARSPRPVDPPPVGGRPPPHDLDAEASVLSACALDQRALVLALEILTADHFYSLANARIWQAMQTLAAAATPVDMTTIGSWLRDREWLQKMGGTAYLAQIIDATPAVGHVGAHAKVVHEKWRLRQLIATCQRVSAEGYGDVGDVQEFIDGADAAVGGLATCGVKAKHALTTTDVADIAMNQITEALTGRVSGTSWGWAPVDDRLGLLMPKGYYVIAARSGHGKTQFTTQTALNIAESPPRDGYANVVYLGSFEMPSVVLLKRTICTEAEVSFKRVNAGLVSDERRFDFDGAECPSCGAAFRPQTYAAMPMSSRGEKHCPDCQGELVAGPSEQERLKLTVTRLRQTQIVWDDRRCTPAELAARVAEIQERAEHGRLTGRDGKPRPKGRVRAVIVDYLQKMPAPPGAYNRSRQVEVAAISNGLVEDVAKGCGVPVVALSQINRGVDKQKDGRPTLADIREAGDIENDADEIGAIHREQYRLREKTPVEFQNVAEFIHLKGRGGLDADLPPARMWFTQGRFHATSPMDDRLCERHSSEAARAQSSGDHSALNMVFFEARTCMNCYTASWATWAERLGVKP